MTAARVLIVNGAWATITAGINNSVTTINLTTGQGARFGTIASPDVMYLTLIKASTNETEHVKVTNRSTDALTVVRAQGGSSAIAFNAGDRIECRPISSVMSHFLQNVDAKVPNLVMNPGFSLLRDPSVTSGNPTADAVSYLFQRWYAYQVAGTTGHMTISQQTGPSTEYPKCVRVLRDASGVFTDSRFKQVLPTSICRQFAGGKATLRFKARKGSGYSQASSALAVVLVSGEGTDQSATAVEGGSWTSQATPLSSSVTLTASWQDFSLTTGTIGASASQLAIGFHNTWGSGAANDYYELTAVKLCVGDTEIPILDEHPLVDEQMCKSFFETLGDGAVANAIFASGKMTDTDTFGGVIRYVPKRVAPTITVSAAADLYVNTLATNDAATAFAVVASALQKNSALITADIATPRTAGQGALLYGASSSARIYVNADFA